MPALRDTVQDAADSLLRAYTSNPQAQRFVAIAGPPGGGKSTFTVAVCEAVNSSLGADIAVVVPMDGFHYPLKALKEDRELFPDPVLAVARRGAPWTFDASAFVESMRALKQKGEGDVPTFDHKIHDPVTGGCRVERTHKIVLIEGNYLLLPDAPWNLLVGENVYDETWFIDTDVEESMRRIVTRHMSVGRTELEARTRADTNDRLNAELVIARSRDLADVLIPCAHK